MAHNACRQTYVLDSIMVVKPNVFQMNLDDIWKSVKGKVRPRTHGDSSGISSGKCSEDTRVVYYNIIALAKGLRIFPAQRRITELVWLQCNFQFIITDALNFEIRVELLH